MKSRYCFVLVWLLSVVVSSTRPVDAQVAGVPSAFSEVETDVQVLSFVAGDAPMPVGGHWQGVQMRHDPERDRHFAFLSHDSATTAYIYVVEFAASLTEPGRIIHRHEFPSDGKSPPLRHSGGIQLIDDVLLVGIEDNQQKTRSEVQFWDVSQPNKFRQLTHLTVQRTGPPKAQTAGAVGLVR